MYASFLQLLGCTLPAQQQGIFVGFLATYMDVASSAVARAVAYRAMWALIAPGINSTSVQMAFAFGRVSLAAAGAGWEIIAGVYTAIATFLAGTAGLVILIVLIALLILIALYLAYNAYQDYQRSQQMLQRQQNDELEKNTKKLFGTTPAQYFALANDSAYGPMYPITTRQLQPGCSIG